MVEKKRGSRSSAPWRVSEIADAGQKLEEAEDDAAKQRELCRRIGALTGRS